VLFLKEGNGNNSVLIIYFWLLPLIFLKKKLMWARIMAHACNPSMREA
jgi:hypothetical protein